MHRRFLAMTARKRFCTYREIAAEIQILINPADEHDPLHDPTLAIGELLWPTYNEKTAWRDVQAELKRLAKQTKETTEQVRQQETIRLDEMAKGVYPLAILGDVKSVEAMLKIMQHKARLYGLEAPVRAELTGKDGAPLQAPVFVYIPANNRDELPTVPEPKRLNSAPVPAIAVPEPKEQVA